MTRRIDDTFLCYNYPKLWEIDDTCGTFVCLSNRQKAFILSSVRFGLWSSRWFVDNGLVKLRDVNPTQLEEALTWVERLHEDIMSDCTSAIQEGLQAIADHLKDISIVQNCGSSGSGCTDVTINVTPGGNTVTGDTTAGPGEGEGEGDPPEGFDTWDDYFEHKCKAAALLVDWFATTLTNFGYMNVVQISGVVIALTMFGAAFPPAGLVLLVVALVALVAARVYLIQLSAYVAENRQEIICSLYESKTSGEAIDSLLGWADSGIDELALTTPIPGQLKAVISALCDAGIFSKLFDAAADVFGATADCSECGEVEPGECELTALDPNWPGTVTKIAENVYDIELTEYSPGWCGVSIGLPLGQIKQLVSVTLQSGTQQGGNRYGVFKYWDGDNWQTPNSTLGGDVISFMNNYVDYWFGGIYFADFSEKITFRLTLSGECGVYEIPE